MSRWGEEIFASDIASDYLYTIVLGIKDSISNCVDESINHTMNPSQRGEAFLMPGIDILRTLIKAYPDIIIHLVSEMPIAKWQEWYLNVFDTQSLQSVEPEFMMGRRKYILESFTELESLLE